MEARIAKVEKALEKALANCRRHSQASKIYEKMFQDCMVIVKELKLLHKELVKFSKTT